MRIHPKYRTRLVVAIAAGALLASGALVAAVLFTGSSASAATTLGSAAQSKGRYFGAAVAAGQLGEGNLKSVLNREFTVVSPEAELQWAATERTQNTFGYADADKIVDSAKSAKQRTRGQALIWPAQLPDWVKNLPTADAMRGAMNGHITNVVGRYKGRVQTWDVVKEAYQDGDGGRRNSALQQKLGNAYVDEAFKTARSADPGAKLCYSDYGIDNVNGGKTKAVYAMVKDLKAHGVPIDCVSVQSRFSAASPVPASFGQAIEQFAALGLDVQITDLAVDAPAAAQTAGFTTVVTACLKVDRCTGITVSAVGGTAQLFDQAYKPKPAYDAVLAALTGKAAAAEPSGSAGAASGQPGASAGTEASAGASGAAPSGAAEGAQPAAPASTPSAPCRVTYVMSKWAGGLTANITIANTGNAQVDGWNLTFTLSAGTTITSGWNATYAPTSGAVTAKGTAGSASIPAGGSVGIGFQGTATADPSKPTDFALNGAACSVA